MTGRAGRAGIDTSGESILIVQKRDKHKVSSLVLGGDDSDLRCLLISRNFVNVLMSLLGAVTSHWSDGILQKLPAV